MPAARLFLALIAGAIVESAAATPLPAVQVSPDGHYLQTAAGRPFFWLGDTAWNLVVGTTDEECRYYLVTRARQGFNIIQTVAIFDSPDPLARQPFHQDDPLQPNGAYFDRVVAMVDQAASLGLYVALVPTWGDKLTAPWGPGPRLFRNDNLDAARSYGAYLGRRLSGRTNLIWVIGGDRPAKLPGLRNTFLQGLAKDAGFAPDQDWTPIWREIAAGIADGIGQDPLCIYHPQGGEFSSSQQLPHEPWIDIHGMQSGHGGGHDIPVWRWVARDYAMSPAKPTIDIEPNYEDHPYNPWPAWDPATGYFRDHDVRKQCYRSIFAGAAGVTYGHHAVWQFASRRNGVINFADRDWVDALHRPGARQMVHLRQLIESRPQLTRIPDPTLVLQPAGQPARLHAVATRDQAGSYAMVYFPDSDLTLEVDLRKLRSARVAAWWYDTRTGFSHPLGQFDATGPQSFKSPPYGPDWVLLLEDPAANYPRPGLAAAG